MQTPEDIRRRVQEMLVESIEVRARHYEDGDWLTGIKGALLEGRIAAL